MAYIANTAFELKVSNNVYDRTANIAGKFINGSAADEICSAGFLCTRSAQYANEGYTNINNLNTWKMIAATSTDTKGVYACNPHSVETVSDASGSHTYKLGNDTLGLPLNAGELGAFTKIDFEAGDKIYRFGVGNIDGDITTQTVFTIDAGLLKRAAEVPSAGTPYFKLLNKGTFVKGAYAGFGYVDVLATIA